MLHFFAVNFGLCPTKRRRRRRRPPLTDLASIADLWEEEEEEGGDAAFTTESRAQGLRIANFFALLYVL